MVNFSPLFSRINFIQQVKLLGPGVLMATAAIGGSHLVASTQAGAKFGWQLVSLILVVNLLKYPFFRAAVSYTMKTGNSLQQGYFHMGKGYLLLSFALNIISAVVNSAALLMFAASLLSYFFPFQLPLIALAAILLSVTVTILVAGHFKALNSAAKIIMIFLVVTTIVATIIAAQNTALPADFVSPSPWTLATIGFLVATMGWMPAPIDVSCITSLWLKEQRKQQNISTQNALFDFNLGYAITMLLAILFVALGALVLHGTGDKVVSSGIGFTHQLVSLYASTIGEWSKLLIALVAFLCIFGSTITIYDGYPRAIAESFSLLTKKDIDDNKIFNFFLIFVALGSFSILLFFSQNLLSMLSFAMTLAFTTTPIFAWLNHKLVKSSLQSSNSSEGSQPKWVAILSILGLIYMFGFLFVFLFWKFW